MVLILGMDHQHHQEPGTAFHDGGGHWPDGGSAFQSHHQSPVHEYTGFAFNPMSMEPMYANSSMPPPRSTHQQLQPLIMPTPQWPSMLTSQSTYSQPIFPSTTMATTPHTHHPVSTPLSAPATTGRHPTSRRTLTDADRRRMCQYAEEHPTVKQTEIGAMFGVERSTVSKVLRNKEKYLHQDDGSKSPVRKSKGKFPDIERALSNWAKNAQKQGLPITDALIREKFKFFATTVGNNESLPKLNNNSWLEKFKQKNHLLGSKSRKNSIAEESETGSTPASGTHSPINTSPTSPAAINKERSPTAMSITKTEAIKDDSPDAFVDFTQGHKPYHSLSNDSLASSYGAAAHSSFSPDPQSPTSPFFTPDTASPFIPHGQPRVASGSSGFQRPRSQTFPMLGVEPYVSPPSSEPLTPKYVSGTVLESPMTELPPSSAVDETVAPAATMQPPPPPSLAEGQPHQIQTSGPAIHGLPLHMSTSQSGLGLSHSSPITPGSTVSSVPPGSPTLEDTRQALQVVIQFFQHQPSDVLNPSEMMLMGALMEKLKLQQSGLSPIQVSVSRGGEMPGGMHRIPSGDFKIRQE